MSFLLWAGMIVGAACGLGHGAYVYNLVSREASKVNSGPAICPKAISYAIWTLALWVLLVSRDGPVGCRMLLLHS